MEHTATRCLHRRTAIICLAIAMAGMGFAQVPATPAATPAPAAAASPEAQSSAMEPVRQAIANQDYAAASRALEVVRQRDPENPHIALYESIIKSRQEEGQTVGAQSPLRTPRPGVTPGPTPEPTPTPVPTPVPTPTLSPADQAAEEGLQAKAEGLWKNETTRYAIIGAGALLLIGIVFLVLKKRRAAKELEEPIQASSLGGGGLEDYSGAGSTDTDYTTGSPTPTVGLAGSPLSGDYTPSTPGTSAYGGTTESQDTGLSGAGGLGGSALAGAGGLAGYTVPSFGEEEEEQAPPPPRNLRPAPKEEDEGPLSLHDDEPPAPAASPVSTPATPLSDTPAGGDHLDALGVNFGGLSAPEEEKPAESNFARPDDETVILSSPPPASHTPTPVSTPSVAPGTVDLEDIFGTQQPTAENAPFSEEPTIAEPFNDQPTLIDPTNVPFSEQPTQIEPLEGMPFDEQPTVIESEDANSQTLPTFVSTPGTENPEENMEVPPKPKPRAASDETISFEELFGGQGMPAAEPAPEPEPAPKAEQYSQPASDISIEDALAATLGAMQAESPDEQPTTAQPAAEAESTESLDERSERMFREQMEKARHAYDEKNWRQAVHFLSIASALHPENEEAKQMLKDARAEKRKAEESV